MRTLLLPLAFLSLSATAAHSATATGTGYSLSDRIAMTRLLDREAPHATTTVLKRRGSSGTGQKWRGSSGVETDIILEMHETTLQQLRRKGNRLPLPQERPLK